ncbi:MAG: zinc-binding alcohol dehydrogenase [Fimbriimonas sp.]|nr:zinc-binding alcohol dehydrogenase [Fimbriimonas sp.]
MTKAHAVAFTEIERAELVSIDLPDLQEGEVLVRTEVSAVSPGTEMRCFAGKQPDSVALPYIPGYSLAGIVTAVTPNAPVSVGQRVFASGTRRASINLQWGGHVSHAIAGFGDVMPLPEGMPVRSAAISKLVAIALRGVRICHPNATDSVVVVGLGPIGMLSARLYRELGCRVLCVDLEPARVAIARKAGMEATEVRGSIEETVRAWAPEGVDVVADATGSPAVLPFSMAALRQPAWGTSSVDGPKLVIQGSYPNSFTLPYQDAFRKELTILMPRDTNPSLVRESISIIAEGRCMVDDLFTWFGDPVRAPEAYGLLQSDRSVMTAAFDWTAYGSP